MLYDADKSLYDAASLSQATPIHIPKGTMILSQANRLYIRRLLRSRAVKILLVLACLINILDILRIHRDITNADRTPPPRPSQPRERIYIASMHWNNGDVLKHHWNDAVIKLAETFGPENVFVSVYESGSWDDTKEALRKLDSELERRGVPRRIETSLQTHHDEIARGDQGEGWVKTSRGTELRRIPYLAKLRNKTIRDLIELHEKGTTFDKVLFLNDVIFTVCFAQLPLLRCGEYSVADCFQFANRPMMS